MQNNENEDVNDRILIVETASTLANSVVFDNSTINVFDTFLLQHIINLPHAPSRTIRIQQLTPLAIQRTRDILLGINWYSRVLISAPVIEYSDALPPSPEAISLLSELQNIYESNFVITNFGSLFVFKYSKHIHVLLNTSAAELNNAAFLKGEFVCFIQKLPPLLNSVPAFDARLKCTLQFAAPWVNDSTSALHFVMKMCEHILQNNLNNVQIVFQNMTWACTARHFINELQSSNSDFDVVNANLDLFTIKLKLYNGHPLTVQVQQNNSLKYFKITSSPVYAY